MSTTTRPTDHAGLEVLDLETCLRLLESQPVGRVAFLEAGQPNVMPVNFARDGVTVVFRTAVGSKFDAAVREAPVAFEVDRYDPETRTGWSVLVRGTTQVVDEEDAGGFADLDLHPWADQVGRPNWVRIRADEISGRRILR